jgi:hypothetical protein
MEAIRVTDMEPNREIIYYSHGAVVGYLVEKENLGLILDNARGYYYDLRFFYDGVSTDYTSVGAALFYYEPLNKGYLLK